MQNETTSASSRAAGNGDEMERFALRYVDLVYAAAVRQMRGDSHAAADVTQTVMLVMLKKARANRLPEERFMAGWVLKVTRFSVMQARRAAARRARHEAKAATSADAALVNGETALVVREVLDAAILKLNHVDREVIVRRYLRGEALAEVAVVIGASENTTGRRAARAVEKLRRILETSGVTAPAAMVMGVLAAEVAVKAPSACAALAMGGTVGGRAANAVLWRMAMAKLAAILFIAVGLLACVAVVVVAGGPLDGPTPAPSRVPSTAPVMAGEPPAVDVRITKVIDENSDAVLKEILAGLAGNRSKLRTIHVVGIVTSGSRDLNTRAWLNPVVVQGEAWAEAGALRRVRDEVSLGQGYVMTPTGQSLPVADKSYIEAWDGSMLTRLYGPPLSPAAGETFDARDLRGESLLGAAYSMQLPWDQETASDMSGTHKTIDRCPLAADVLAQMKLTARHVQLDGGPAYRNLLVRSSARIWPIGAARHHFTEGDCSLEDHTPDRRIERGEPGGFLSVQGHDSDGNTRRCI
jgi:RNA polymerase sigma factor (sigma-70 family)